MSKPHIGMVGVGLMGHGIALNILKHGWPLSFLEHPGNQPTGELEALHGQGMTDRATFARQSDILILCVNGTPQVEAILLGEDGLLASVRPGTIIIDCSTAVPSSTIRLAGLAAAAGARMMDAAMTRTPLEAAQGRLNLLIGADAALYEEVTPLLSAFSENRFHAGPVGAGHTLKLLHNFVSLGFTTLLGEAAACAAAGGIEPAILVDALQKGGGSGAALDRVAPYLLEGDVSRMRFSIANAQKDLAYYVRMAEDLGSAHSIASGTLAALTRLTEAGFAQSFVPEAASLFPRVAG
ncbi:NAD(P)-dependent oxidoreductase [Acidisoma sp. 7E03]